MSSASTPSRLLKFLNSPIRAAVLAVVTGCATAPPDPAAMREATTPLLCTSKAQCDLYWQRAQVWISENGAYRVRLANDIVIETHGPIGSRVDMAYRVTKHPTTAESARITILAGCANFIRCYPTAPDAAISFKRFVTQSTGAVTVGPAPVQAVAVVSKYAFSAEALAKSTGCAAPVSTMNFKTADSETFSIACAKGDPLSVRCENGQCRTLK